MPTSKQETGKMGEVSVVKNCSCPRCKNPRTLKQLRANFKCADVICDFCGYLAQVKAKNVDDITKLPKTILGAAWEPQEERMKAGIYIPLYIVLVDKEQKFSIWYLSADLQPVEMFKKRKPLSAEAKRPGWQGFFYDLTTVDNGLIARIK